MRLFLAEMGKLWNWRILLVIAALTAATFATLLQEPAHNSRLESGAFGPYQIEMFQRYGDTLEPEELADFDIPGRIAEADAVIAAQMASNPVFARHGVTNRDQWEAFVTDLFASQVSYDPDHPSPTELDYRAMSEILGSTFARTAGGAMVGWSASDSPLVDVQHLLALQDRYDQATIDQMVEDRAGGDRRPTVQRQVAAFPDHAHNLIDYQVPDDFSLYAAVSAVLVVVSVMLMVGPVMARDRVRRIRQLQYSSQIGRAIAGRQLAATLVSALLLSLGLTAILWTAFFLVSGAGQYWGAHIANLDHSFWMWNLTFGSYVLLLTGLIALVSLAMAGTAFALSSTSASMVTMFTKVAPVAVGLSVLGAASLFMASTSDNIVFSRVFRGQLPLPEILVCALVAVVGILLGWVLARRELRRDQ